MHLCPPSPLVAVMTPPLCGTAMLTATHGALCMTVASVPGPFVLIWLNVLIQLISLVCG